MSEKIKEIISFKFKDKVSFADKSIDCLTVYLKNKDDLISFMEFIKENEDLEFNLISDITAIDYPNKAERFMLVYHVFSIKNKERIRVKLSVKEGDSVKSITSVYRGAEWLEREVYDMFGVTFEGHPDLRRILMNEDFKYHPLRKDFPLMGIEES